MRHRNRLIILIVIAAGLLLAACGGQASDDEVSGGEPAKVEPVGGTDLNRVILSAEAAKRLDIQTAPVRSEGSGTEMVIPYAAVLYDPNGETWTYTNPEPLTFVRQDIKVDHIEGDLAVLLEGPPSGSAVVTVGATELWGIEYGGIEED